MTKPIGQNGSEDRGSNGRFVKGWRGGPGRPPGIDFRKVVEERAAAAGVSIEEAMWDIYLAMVERAKGGDVNAAKLILERLCAPVGVSTGDDMNERALNLLRTLQAMRSATEAKEQ